MALERLIENDRSEAPATKTVRMHGEAPQRSCGLF
jgi:hypothetical protein